MSFGIGGGNQNPNKDYEVQPASPDSVQDIAWGASGTGNLLASGSWDKTVRVWEVQQQGQQLNAVAKAQITHDGPVLSTAFSGDGSTVFSGSTDKTAKMWQLGGAQQGQQIAQHDAPIKFISPIQEMNTVVTGSWDKTLKYWDTRTPNAQMTVQLPERVYAMDVRYPLMLVATAERHIMVYDLKNPQQAYRQIESMLKFQTRSVAAFPDKSGFAVGSIEGRCGIMHVDKNDEKKNFAFKCHRDGNDVYPVNGINFHPTGTFATCGGDGTFNFWDKDIKQRLKSFQKMPLPISVGKFNSRGDIFAYSASYDWGKGASGYNASQQSKIYLHFTQEDEIRKKK